jgi:hypothetical protein
VLVQGQLARIRRCSKPLLAGAFPRSLGPRAMPQRPRPAGDGPFPALLLRAAVTVHPWMHFVQNTLTSCLRFSRKYSRKKYCKKHCFSLVNDMG